MVIMDRKEIKREIVTFDEKLDIDNWSAKDEIKDLLEASEILKIKYIGFHISDYATNQYHYEYEIKYIAKD